MAEEQTGSSIALPGEVLAGKYRIERQLGAGGMGVVVQAMHLELDQRVAIKFLYPDAVQNAEAVTRFGREARAAAKIRSEHAVKVLDVGKLDNGAPYMVMEYLEGKDLGAIVEGLGPVAVLDAVEYLLQACEAIAEAHTLGIVHRDVKSANLFLTRRPDGSASIKVLDFGVSKMMVLDADGATVLTKTQTVMGSPAYMAPEQMMSAKNVDARSDIWGLGVILFELLTGSMPFPAETMMELCSQIVRSPMPPITRPDVPPGLVATVKRCLEKAPADRFRTVAELSQALAPFGPEGSDFSARRVGRVLSKSRPVDSHAGEAPEAPAIAAPALTQAAAKSLAPWDSSGPGQRSKLPFLAAGVVLGAALFGGGLVLVLNRVNHPPRRAPEAAATTVDDQNRAPERAPSATASTAQPASAEPANTAPAAASSPAPAAETASPPPTRPPKARPAGSARKPQGPRPARKPGADPFDTRY